MRAKYFQFHELTQVIQAVTNFRIVTYKVHNACKISARKWSCPEGLSLLTAKETISVQAAEDKKLKGKVTPCNKSSAQ